jgi:RNA polymerase sigma factor (sigma-70 family)
VGAVQNSETRITLLGRLQRDPSDPQAWSEFVGHYGRKIYGWCRNWGLQDADAQDVTQHVLLKLVDRFRDFRYEPAQSFRAWLKTLTHHAWHDYLKARRRPGQGSGDSSILKLIASAEAREDLALRLQDAFDRELLDEAMGRVRLRIEPRTWDAFQLLAIDDWSGAQAAQHLGMKVATVFAYRSKVLRMIREEVTRLDRGSI